MPPCDLPDLSYRSKTFSFDLQDLLINIYEKASRDVTLICIINSRVKKCTPPEAVSKPRYSQCACAALVSLYSAVCKLWRHAMAKFLHLSGRERISCIYWTLATPFLGWFSILIQSFTVFYSPLQSFTALFCSNRRQILIKIRPAEPQTRAPSQQPWQHTQDISRGSRNTSDFGPLPSFLGLLQPITVFYSQHKQLSVGFCLTLQKLSKY